MGDTYLEYVPISPGDICLKVHGPWDYISKIKEVLKDHGFRWDPTIKVWVRRYGYGPYLLQELTKIGLCNPEDVHPNLPSDAPDKILTAFPFLMKHQVNLALFFYKLHYKCMLIAWEMGCGKTIGSAVLSRLWGRRALVVATSSLLNQWGREVKKFGLGTALVLDTKYIGKKRVQLLRHAPKYDYVIMSYETVKMFCDIKVNNKTGTVKAKLLPEYIEFFTAEDRLLIFDETFKIKNHKSQLHKACLQLRLLNWWGVVGLSGTPMENKLIEFYTLINFLRPQFMSWMEFTRHHTVYGDYGIEKFINLKRFNSRILDVMDRVLKTDVRDNLPDLVCNYRFVYSGKEQHRYRRQLFEESPSIFPIYRLLQTLDSCYKRTDDGNLLGVNAKLEEVLNILDDINGHSILIFTAFTTTAKWLAEKIQANNYSVEYVSGDLKSSDKDAVEGRFLDGVTQVVIATDTWAYGKDFPEVDYLIQYDLLPNPAKMNQRRDRIYRVNSKNGKTVTVLVGDVIEQDIYKILYEKSKNTATAVDGLTEENLLQELSKLYGKPVGTGKGSIE